MKPFVILCLEIGNFNDGSRTLAERLGFEREGRLREHVFFRGTYHDTLFDGLLRDEWKPEFDSHQ
ncbi:GNAT family N-acetyltransferase [Haladaptatus sp. CMAA 1911]|uniref:GNAT family N-acetyltransferase n=1 Tax=unclassified Haladaptatus TaxID=2622732 RepID=UPI0037544F1C